MANRPHAFPHADNTPPERDGHERMDELSMSIDPRFMQVAIPSPYSPQHGRLPLGGFWRLYEAQLRSERKSANTIRIYGNALTKFSDWCQDAFGRSPTLDDFSSTNVRLFLGDEAEQPKWRGHPTLEGFTKNKVAVGTIHQYTRGLKTFGAWLERERYAAIHPLYSVRAPRGDDKQLHPLTEEKSALCSTRTATTTQGKSGSRRFSSCCSTLACD
jgi:hypothetical protein